MITSVRIETGGLFRMISRLVIAQSEFPKKAPNLDRLMTLLGRYFQIRDDYTNLVSDQVIILPPIKDTCVQGWHK